MKHRSSLYIYTPVYASCLCFFWLVYVVVVWHSGFIWSIFLLQDTLQDLPVDKYQQLLPLFQPTYLSLIENLLIKVQYPIDEVYDTWTAGILQHLFYTVVSE